MLAKTFAFRKDDANGQRVSENVVETRLLIKRPAATGATWVGLPYIWNKDGAGRLTTADLHVEGGVASVEFDYLDPDPDVVDTGNPPQRRRYKSATTKYAIPAALNALPATAATTASRAPRRWA